MNRLIAIASIMLIAVMPSSSQDGTVEYQVKAAFLFNFAKFVEWPNQAFTARDSAFTICLAGDPFQGAMERTIEGETWNGRPLSIRRIESGSDVRACQIVFVSQAEAAKNMGILMAAASAPVLTVGETDDFIAAGGIIRFIETGSRIRFEINPDAADRVSLRLSSRLLRLADIVRLRQRAGK